jgi:hypothetical protein
MNFSENRFAFFRIMPCAAADAQKGGANRRHPASVFSLVRRI